MHWSNDYVGLPFVDGGRDRGGVDCWGLIRLVLKDQCEIEVPSYGTIAAKDLMSIAKQMEISNNMPPWKTVTTPRQFDIVGMLGRAEKARAMIHVGIMASDTHLIHVERLTDSVMLPLTHPSVKNRICGFYRHEQLA